MSRANSVRNRWLFSSRFFRLYVVQSGATRVNVTTASPECTPLVYQSKSVFARWGGEIRAERFACVASCVAVRQCCLTRKDAVILGTRSGYVKWVPCFMAASSGSLLQDDFRGRFFSVFTLKTSLTNSFFILNCTCILIDIMFISCQTEQWPWHKLSANNSVCTYVIFPYTYTDISSESGKWCKH